MENINLDDIPELIKSCRLSEQEACMQIYLILYENPARFNLLDMDEDSRSDFLLNFIETKTAKLIQNYNPEISQFGAYVYATIQTAKLSFMKKRYEESFFSNTCVQESIQDFKQKMEEDSHIGLKIADENPSYPQKSSITNKTAIETYQKLFGTIHHRLNAKDSKKRRFQRGILILALKSAWYITDEQIHKVSVICDIPDNIISDSVCTLKSKLINKALNRKEIEDKRNRAYAFINSYRQRLNSSDISNNEIKFKKLQSRLDFQITNFKAKTNLLKNGRFKICPTNSEIAEILGLSDRIISCHISRLKSIDFSSMNII